MIEQHPDGYYLVPSETVDLPHLVDLEAFNGNGFCTCRDFSCVCMPNYNKGEGRTQCKHIKFAKAHSRMIEIT